MVRREGLQLPRRPGPPDRRLARKKQACLESIEEDPSSFRCEAVANVVNLLCDVFENFAETDSASLQSSNMTQTQIA
eukprot:CAMPEP_0178438122 /NCGR_PEP_ID=MMETSP0689_2-20121128/35397_1 /TAXON_ID=160604 /ORGANISM="Amphidinium massartii, Strain CS-259" /LENGTH=76 /DNA_ID=CAMNT_0020060449 /DNA_START=159 /DNA_END=390 /DNA_ORIENTATION=+